MSLVAAALLIALWAFSLPLHGQVVDLSGPAKFRLGDDPRWADPDMDDADWATVTVPANLFHEPIHYQSWRNGWYRIAFTLPETLSHGDLAISLGLIGNADAVYVDGILLGQHGRTLPFPAIAPRLERVYRIPTPILKARTHHLLAVRVWTAFGHGGISHGPVVIGPYERLKNQAYLAEQPARIIEAITLAVIAIFCLGAILLSLAIQVGPVLKRLLSLLLLLLFMRGITSFPIYEWGWFQHRSFVWLLTGYLFAPLATTHFTAALIQKSLPQRLWRLTFWLTLISATLLHFPHIWQTNQDHWLTWVLTATWLLSTILNLTLLLRTLQQGICARHPEWIAVIVGLSGLCIAYLLPITGVSTVFPRWIDSYIIEDIALLGFLMSMAIAGTLQHLRVSKQVATLSDRVLLAHEEERARLSRELHDGVAQSLQAIRLKTKIVRARAPEPEQVEPALDQLAEDIGKTLDELRAVSRDLRPASLDTMTLGEALSWYGHQMEDQTEVERIEIQDQLRRQPPQRTVEHLYRICQEGVINAIRHGHATKICLSLVDTEDDLTVTIHDNGRGFEIGSHRRNGQGAGIGLTNMKDRTQLLGGDCLIDSHPDLGTTITLTIPQHSPH